MSQVLRFKGYFTEQVEGGRQVCRIRPVVIFYYLVDDAIAVTEPRTPVSSIHVFFFFFFFFFFLYIIRVPAKCKQK